MTIKSFWRRITSSLVFDSKDYALLDIVNDVLNRADYPAFRHLLAPYQHPRGIKELTAGQGLRIAYAAVNLLGSLEMGKAHDRIEALQALRDEAMNVEAGHLRRNTARVLMQIMKELVRSQGDEKRRLELAHDFHRAATGKTRIIERQLSRYHLSLMPEDWVQVSFDNHVHDANTKGRKSATHLIMDAWIKGIRSLTVVYYNFVNWDVAEELLQAAQVMGINVRLGIEFQTKFKAREVKIIWVPRGFTGPEDFLKFLAKPRIAAFMEQGRKLSKIQEEQVMAVLGEFNAHILPAVNQDLGVGLAPLDREDFTRFVGQGQASLLHLGKFIHSRLLPVLEERFAALQEAYRQAGPEDRGRIEDLAVKINSLDADTIIDDYLEPMITPGQSPRLGREISPLYCSILTSRTLTSQILEVWSANRFVLDLKGLTGDEVLEILHESKGRITHLEIVNLKNAAQEGPEKTRRIAQLMQAVNSSSLIPLKHWIMSRLEALQGRDSAEASHARTVLGGILHDIAAFHGLYRGRPLQALAGSDSTGQSSRMHGMGLVAGDTLPEKSRRALERSEAKQRQALAVGLTIEPRIVFEPRSSANPWLKALQAWAREYPVLRSLGYKSSRAFRHVGFYPAPKGESNLYTLGGVRQGFGNNLFLDKKTGAGRSERLSWDYLNTGLRNVLKAALGFIPAFLAFYLTRDWLVLKWFGAFIWFAITGVRNVIQSVLGGGGLSRTPLLKWRDYVNWERLSDSLLYTGLSVPLLDYLVKTVILDRGLSITVASSPLILYAVMNLANGLYICGHNLLRGLPRADAFWNIFRGVLAIPLSMAMSWALGRMLSPHDPVQAAATLQQWAAIIAKLASDCVAGLIEGLVDREYNLDQRLGDYDFKIEQMLMVQEKLESLFPEADVLLMLSNPKEFMNNLSQGHKDQELATIVNSLDFLYFWMYKPRGRVALERVLRDMTVQVRQAFLLTQYVLLRKREISRLFLDGLVGKNFSKALALYLDYADEYLDALQLLAARTPPPQNGDTHWRRPSLFI